MTAVDEALAALQRFKQLRAAADTNYRAAVRAAEQSYTQAVADAAEAYNKAIGAALDEYNAARWAPRSEDDTSWPVTHAAAATAASRQCCSSPR